MGFIIPNPWLTNLRQGPTRRAILDHARIDEIVHFTFPVFQRAKATVDTEIVMLKRLAPKGGAPSISIVGGTTPSGDIDFATATRIAHSQSAWRKSADLPINIFLDAKAFSLRKKMRSQGPELALLFRTSVGMKPYQVGKGRPKQTRKEVEARAYDARAKLGPEFRQHLRGSDIGRFSVAPLEERFIKYGPWLAEPRVSAGFDASQKIVMRQTGDSLVAALDKDGFLCMNNMHILVGREQHTNLYSVLALLNSKAMNWYYQALNPEMGEALAEVKKANIDRLPLPRMSPTLEKALAKYARSIEANRVELEGTNESHRRLLLGLIRSDVERLDKAVYEAFSLTRDEVQIIESTQKKHVVV